MKNGAPWSVKGIEPEARETAKAEARKMGKTLGQWLNQVIKENSQNGTDGKAADSPMTGDSGNSVHARLEELARELAQISQNKQSGTGASESQEPESREDKVTRALNELSDRFELSERQTAELLSEFRDDLNLLAHQMSPPPAAETQFTPPPAPQTIMPAGAPAQGQDMKNLEQALALVVDHIELTDKRNADVLKSLQSRLSDVTARLGRPVPAASVKPVAHADLHLQKIAELEARIGQLAAMSGQSTPSQAPEDNLKSLQENIAALAQRLNQMRADPRPAKAISSLNNRYEELAGRLYEAERQIPDQEQVNEIEHRLKELAQRLEQSLETSNPHPQIADLESRISELAVQLESAQDKKRWEEVLPQLDDKFGQIHTRLDETEKRFKTLDTFEGRIEQLFKGLEQTRATVGETARMAAEQAINQVAGKVAQQSTQAAVQQANTQAQEIANRAIAHYAESNRAAVQEAAELAAAQAVAKMGGGNGEVDSLRSAFSTLEQGLDDVRANTDSVEKRTQETLQTVHDSLEKVMERLGTLEEKFSQGRESASLYDSPKAADEGPGGDLRLPPIGEQPPSHGGQGDALHLNEGLDQIYGAGTVTGGPNSEPSAPFQSPPSQMGGLNRNEDFIAAARRAAKTAAELPTFGEESDNSAADSSHKAKISKLGSVIASKRKPLLYGVAAIALLGGLYVISSMLGSNQPDVTVSESILETPPPAATVQPEMTDKAPAPSNESPAKIAAVPPAAEDKPVQPPVMDKAEPKAPAIASMPAPASTNSIPPAQPIAMAARPANPAAMAPGGSSIIAKSKPEARSTGDLPDSIGSASLRAAAVSGNPNAQYEIATGYANGKGVEKDMEKALSWYRKAAARGLPLAQYRLGTLYEKGRGVKKDRPAARIWYSRAAIKGNRKAMHNLAVMNAEGGDDGTKPDFTKAAQWFRKAAELGLTDSQFNLAILSERGLGVPQSQIEAYKWFALASKNGDKDAASRLDTIANQLDSKTLVKARMAVKKWTAKPVNVAANRVVIPNGGWENAKAVASSSSERLVTDAQTLLSRLGYNPGPADGMMGENTRQAIMKFQSNEGLPVDGKITPDLIARLKAAIS